MLVVSTNRRALWVVGEHEAENLEPVSRISQKALGSPLDTTVAQGRANFLFTVCCYTRIILKSVVNYMKYSNTL